VDVRLNFTEAEFLKLLQRAKAEKLPLGTYLYREIVLNLSSQSDVA
jgi:hypothetical protein